MSAGGVVLVGVDPGLDATGLVVLRTLTDAPIELGPLRQGAEVMAMRAVGAPAKGTLGARLAHLAQAVTDWLEVAVPEALYVAGGYDLKVRAVVMEDATVFRRQAYRSGISVGRKGAAVGVVALVLQQWAQRFAGGYAEYGADEWVPKQNLARGGGRWVSPVKREHVQRWIRGLVRGLDGASEHEVMAAGVALFHHWAQASGYQRPGRRARPARST